MLHVLPLIIILMHVEGFALKEIISVVTGKHVWASCKNFLAIIKIAKFDFHKFA